MPDCAFRQTTEQHTAAITMTRPLTQIGPAMAEAYPKIYHAITSAGLQPAGMPLARYFEMDESSTTFECAIPVPEPIAATSEVKPGSIGGGEVACTVHVGPYRKVGETWAALTAWVTEQGRAPAGPGWEVYVDDPNEVPEAELRTEVCVPVA